VRGLGNEMKEREGKKVVREKWRDPSLSEVSGGSALQTTRRLSVHPSSRHHKTRRNLFSIL